jgi:hypothetical protein
VYLSLKNYKLHTARPLLGLLAGRGLRVILPARDRAPGFRPLPFRVPLQPEFRIPKPLVAGT